MWTGIDFLFFLQDLRESLPDIITQFFVFVAGHDFQYFIPVLLMAVLYWCIGEREGELLMFNFGFSNLVGYLVKNIVKIPRPWVLDPDLHPTPEAKAGAPGYSMPSGHTVSAVSAFGTLAWLSRRRKVFAAFFLSLTVLFPFGRMFLTVHTPLDIITAVVIVIVVSCVNFKVLEWSYESERNRMYVLTGYLMGGIGFSVACDIIAGKMLSNKMCGFCIALPLCLMIKERFFDNSMLKISLTERVVSILPGLAACALMMMAVYFLLPSHRVTVTLTAAIVFVVLVYPPVMRRVERRIYPAAVA